METLDSVVANLVLRMKEIVISIITVRMISSVDQTIAQHLLDLIITQIVVMSIMVMNGNK